MLRLSHILTTAALVAVCAAPASAATYEELHSNAQSDDASQAAADTGWRSSYQPAPPSETGQGQDLRSPDTVDAAQHRGIYAPDSDTYVLNRDYGSPDALDAAARTADREAWVLNRDYGSPDAMDAGRNLPPAQVPTVVAHGTPSAGFNWGDAGIGAAGMFGLFAIAAGSALLLLTIRRRGQRLA
jgi:hypothetical protein